MAIKKKRTKGTKRESKGAYTHRLRDFALVANSVEAQGDRQEPKHEHEGVTEQP